MDCTREIPARRRISVTFAGTIVLLAAFAPTAFAECMNWPLEATKQPRIAFAFVATVTDIERHEMFEAGSGEFRYRITLETERVYRGRIRESVELTGTNSGCSFLDKSGLAEGERLFIASERLRPDAHETDLGNVLAWKRTGSQWMFYEDALRDGSDETYYQGPRARQQRLPKSSSSCPGRRCPIRRLLHRMSAYEATRLPASHSCSSLPSLWPLDWLHGA